MSLVSFGIVVGWITLAVLGSAILAFCAYIIWQGLSDRRGRLNGSQAKDELPPLPTQFPGQHRRWPDVKAERNQNTPHDPAP